MVWQKFTLDIFKHKCEGSMGRTLRNDLKFEKSKSSLVVFCHIKQTKYLKTSIIVSHFATLTLTKLVGGFNPLEKYKSNWESSLNRGENNTYLKPLPRKHSSKILSLNNMNPANFPASFPCRFRSPWVVNAAGVVLHQRSRWVLHDSLEKICRCSPVMAKP